MDRVTDVGKKQAEKRCATARKSRSLFKYAVSIGPRLMILSIRVTVTDELHRETAALPTTAALFSDSPPAVGHSIDQFPLSLRCFSQRDATQLDVIPAPKGH